MIEVARALAAELDNVGIPVFAAERGFTASHRFAVMAAEFGGGQTASKRLRKAGFLASGIGLPVEAVEGDLNGLRIGTPELVRWGVTASDVPQLAALVARALRSDDPEALVPQVADLRTGFDTVHFVS
ncbi:MAG: hypothetical protein LJE67_07370 [Salaquimonas sp.]|nr:hypothetical protein [Salaquimonas sp.]